MSFVGIVASKKCFETIRKEIMERLQDETISFIHINLRSIENVKNIKFETIIIEDKMDKFKQNQESLNKIFENAQYVLINTDKNKENVIKGVQNIISYGLNHNAIVTVSSICDTDILIYWQKSIQDREGNETDIEERRIKKGEQTILNIYEIMIIYTFFKIYNKSIIEKV